MSVPTMTEAVLTRKIVAALNEAPRTWAVKIHGGPHQVAGIPDILCCSDGHFVGLEVKLPGRERHLTEIQSRTLNKIGDAGGTARMVTSIKQAMKEVFGGDTY